MAYIRTMLNCFYILLGFSLFIILEAAPERPLRLCSIKEEECLNSFYQDLLVHFSEHGGHDIGIPVVDPMEVKDVSLLFLNSVNVTVTEGTIEGLGKCHYERNFNDFEKMEARQVIVCDVTLNSKFIVTGSNKFVQQLFGTDTLDGHGDMVLKMETLRIDFTLPFKVEKRDGKTYLNYSEHQNPDFEVDVQNAQMSATNVIIAKQNFTEFMNMYFNQNWKSLMQDLGKPVVSHFLDLYLNYAHKFFASLSTDQFIKEDLSSYVS